MPAILTNRAHVSDAEVLRLGGLPEVQHPQSPEGHRQPGRSAAALRASPSSGSSPVRTCQLRSAEHWQHRRGTCGRLEQKLDAQVTTVACPGGGPAMLGAIGGHVDSMVIILPAAIENIHAGNLCCACPTACCFRRCGCSAPAVPTRSGIRCPTCICWPASAAWAMRLPSLRDDRQRRATDHQRGGGLASSVTLPRTDNPRHTPSGSSPRPARWRVCGAGS
ncbi:hypothetical protein EV687_3739 [Corticibacter populi]|nr:hypothetical protein EV687_3739 [Corticibacter populi]